MLFKKPTATHTLFPPLIVNCVNEFAVCASQKDVDFWLTPKNIAQSTSFVIYDPDGSLFLQHGRTFRRSGYQVKVFNPSDFELSAKYNPFEYVEIDEDISKLVTAVLSGTKGRGKKGDISFLRLESVLLTAIIGYIHEEAPSYEHNFAVTLEMLNAMTLDEDYDYFDDYKHAVDCLFEDAKTNGSDGLYVKRYEHFKRTAGINENKVVKSCISRLYPFGSDEAKEYFSTDELGLNRLYNPQTALFVTPGKSGAFSFTAPLMYVQLFDVLCEKSIEY